MVYTEEQIEKHTMHNSLFMHQLLQIFLIISIHPYKPVSLHVTPKRHDQIKYTIYNIKRVFKNKGFF